MNGNIKFIADDFRYFTYMYVTSPISLPHFPHRTLSTVSFWPGIRHHAFAVWPFSPRLSRPGSATHTPPSPLTPPCALPIFISRRWRLSPYPGRPTRTSVPGSHPPYPRPKAAPVLPPFLDRYRSLFDPILRPVCV